MDLSERQHLLEELKAHVITEGEYRQLVHPDLVQANYRLRVDLLEHENRELQSKVWTLEAELKQRAVVLSKETA